MAASVSAVATSGLSAEIEGRPVLDGITFAVDPGAFVAVVGPNGAGKTTLLRVLLGLVVPTAGDVSLFGQSPGAADAGETGYVPQVKTLDRTFPARAVDLVLTASRGQWPFRVGGPDRDRATAALRQVGAEPLADRPLHALSGGELQRVYLARALVRRPRLVLLDEPATGIDVAGAADLYDVLEKDQAEHDTTVVMVTHDWTAAYHHATHALLLDGTQVSFGPPEEALDEACLREAFGHIGHAHAMLTASSAHVD